MTKRRFGQRRRAMVALAAVVPAVAGTALILGAGTDGGFSIKTHEDQGLRVFSEEQDIMQLAADSGTLEYLEDEKCFVLRHAPYQGLPETKNLPVQHSLLVWPAGTIAFRDNGQIGVRVPDQGEFYQGDQLSVGGGGLLDQEIAALQNEYPVAARCVEAGVLSTWKVEKETPQP